MLKERIQRDERLVQRGAPLGEILLAVESLSGWVARHQDELWEMNRGKSFELPS